MTRPLRRSRPAFFVLAAVTLAASHAPAPDSGGRRGPEDDPHVRGITVSTPRMGQEWGSDQMVECIEELRGLGANWFATHPYGRLGNDGRVWSRIDPDDPPAWLTRPIREAHARGMRVLIKPHLAYWGSGFSWRGAIDFGDDEAAWQRFWDSYEQWIVDQARIAKDADAFAIGTELDRTLHDEARWRRIVERVREVTDAHLTYAANWSDYRRVGFWDALDCIGIQAYFPLTDRRTRDRDAIARGWSRRMRELREFSILCDGMPIVFTELGYNRSFDAPVQPWDYRQDGRDAIDVQRTCLEVALEAIADEPVVVGAFLWKWFPRPSRRDHDFKLQTPVMRSVLRDAWAD